MIRFIRIVGFVLIVIGTLITIAWFIDPVREAMPHVWRWIRELPVLIQIGGVIAAVGFVLLVSSLLWERWEDREADRGLKDED